MLLILFPILLLICSHILGLRELGDILLEKFRWGPSFFDINEDILNLYAECKDSEDVVKTQNEYLEKLKRENEEKKNIGWYILKAEEFKQFSLSAI